MEKVTRQIQRQRRINLKTSIRYICTNKNHNLISFNKGLWIHYFAYHQVSTEWIWIRIEPEAFNLNRSSLWFILSNYDLDIKPYASRDFSKLWNITRWPKEAQEKKWPKSSLIEQNTVYLTKHLNTFDIVYQLTKHGCNHAGHQRFWNDRTQYFSTEHK